MDSVDPAMDGFLGSVRRARVQPGEIALWYIGAAGYIIRTEQATLLTDPFLGPSLPPEWLRATPPAFAPERIGELEPLDGVLITHEHDDHADPTALRAIADYTSAPVFFPASSLALVEEAGLPGDRQRVTEHEESFTVSDLRVTSVAMLDLTSTGCNGYVLETAGTTVLLGGDSLYFDGFSELGKRSAFDAICVSVGMNPPGITYYMDESDAARAARDSGTKMLIPQHFNLWQGITLDPRRVRTVTSWYAPEVRVIPARFGQRLTVMGDG